MSQTLPPMRTVAAGSSGGWGIEEGDLQPALAVGAGGPVDGQDEAAAGLTDGLAAAGVGAGLCAGPALLDCRTYNP